MRNRYLVIFEKERGRYGAYVPDLPGCVAVARTLPQVRRLIREAIGLHVEDMQSRGERLPKPQAAFEYVEASAA